MRLIDADALKEKTVEERKTGYWIDEGCHEYSCSECGGMVTVEKGSFKFCPYCGARMEER